MADPATEPARPAPGESYLAIAARSALVLAGVAALAFGLRARPPAEAPPAPVPVAVVAPVPAEAPAPPPPAPKPAPKPKPAPEPKAPRVLEPDRAKLAAAEGAVDAASRDRARADARAADAGRLLSEVSARVAAEAARGKTLSFRVRDPSARIARAAAQGGFLKADRDRVKAELDALAKIPRPVADNIVARNPVARPAKDKEYHFEVRGNRVAFIDLDRLIELVTAEAKIKIRMSDGRRPISGTAGPVGAFSLKYVLAPTLPESVRSLLDGRAAYDLAGWEVVPTHETRGETYDMSLQPASEYGRAVRRIAPEAASVTFWVYPDSFALYRRLRDDLHARGFLVAARPMPAGIPVRGSPSGSLSAGQ